MSVTQRVERAVNPLLRLDWLILLLLSWVPPIVVVQLANQHHYFLSLSFWTIPIAVLGYRSLRIALPDAASRLSYSRRRRALYWTVGYIVGAGLLLDFGLGAWVLRFDVERWDRQYKGAGIPIGDWVRIPFEEVLFYVLAPVAIVLVYAWADEYYLHAYNQRERLRVLPADARLLRFSPRIAAACGALFGVAGIFWASRGILPLYFCFLIVFAFGPAMLLYRSIEEFINWPAFAVTLLYVVSTSILWEATLAVPNRWWGYQESALLGIYVSDWGGPPGWPFPVEAALVWLCAPFSCVFFYEFIKARQYRRSATAVR